MLSRQIASTCVFSWFKREPIYRWKTKRAWHPLTGPKSRTSPISSTSCSRMVELLSEMDVAQTQIGRPSPLLLHPNPRPVRTRRKSQGDTCWHYFARTAITLQWLMLNSKTLSGKIPRLPNTLKLQTKMRTKPLWMISRFQKCQKALQSLINGRRQLSAYWLPCSETKELTSSPTPWTISRWTSLTTPMSWRTPWTLLPLRLSLRSTNTSAFKNSCPIWS